jgi:formylglycine-generating enzyme required for sulfatase activity
MIFSNFFDDIFVARELSKLLHGRSSDREELRYLFEQAGYDAKRLPELDFKEGIAAFEMAFVETALSEKSLKDRIQAGNLLNQARLQRVLLAEVRMLLRHLRSKAWGKVGIQAGIIHANHVVSGVQVIHEWGQSSPLSSAGDPFEGMRRQYLSELARDVNRLPWSVVEEDYAHPEYGEVLGIAEIYTDLDVSDMKHVEEEEDLRRFLDQVIQDETKRTPAHAMINRASRLVVLGDPGSGKSTLVKHLTYVLAKAHLSTNPESWLSRIDPWHHGLLLPVWIEMRSLAVYAEEEENLEGAALILGYLRSYLQEWGVKDFWLKLRNIISDCDETLLILFDGLDEVAAEMRKKVSSAVQDFVERYLQHRYVVTCRPYAYVGQPFQLRYFKEVTLAPFSMDQVEQFIRVWYKELAKRDRLSSRQAKNQADQMQRAVHQSDLRGLAQRPLLLTVMTLLNTFRGQLPQDRTELYADAVDLLLRRWQGRFGDEMSLLERLNTPGLKMSDLESGLYAVAYRAHSESGSAESTADVDEGDLRKWLAPYLGNDWNKAGEFLDYIRGRAGLLVRHKREAYTFPHRSFQEFMAACHLLGLGDYPGKAVGLIREESSKWREIFLLAAGYAARTHRLVQAISAVNALCPKDVRDVAYPDVKAYRLAGLAGEALLEIGLIGVGREDVGKAVLSRIRAWLVDATKADSVLTPWDRAQAGDLLARLGDPRPGIGLLEGGVPDITWCKVPAGPFSIGGKSRGNRVGYGKTSKYVYKITSSYLISRYPITRAQYSAFIETGGYRKPHYWTKMGWKWLKRKGSMVKLDCNGAPIFGNHPVSGVSWYEALAFCNWLTEVMFESGRLARGFKISLPTEAQWEKAARGIDERTFPWGENPDPNRANYDDTGVGTISTVGCFPGGVSFYKVEGMSGNVWEWTQSIYKGYPYDPEDGRENLNAGDGIARVLRGGSFESEEWLIRCAYRGGYIPSTRYMPNGFRVAASPLPSSHD